MNREERKDTYFHKQYGAITRFSASNLIENHMRLLVSGSSLSSICGGVRLRSFGIKVIVGRFRSIFTRSLGATSSIFLNHIEIIDFQLGTTRDREGGVYDEKKKKSNEKISKDMGIFVRHSSPYSKS